MAKHRKQSESAPAPSGRDEMLTEKQTKALEWLLANPWCAKPHAGWPKELSADTYHSLSLKKFIVTKRGEWSESTVYVTAAGKQALCAKREK